MEYLEFRAMNTQVVLAAEGAREEVERGFAAAREVITADEARFTRFSEQSELSRLNRAAGTVFRASPELFDVVRRARQLWHETEGLADPTILGALERAGYDRSMDVIRAQGVVQPGPYRIGARPDFGAIEMDEGRRVIWMPEGMRLDLGGIAKGWIAEHAANELANYATACAVNAGGDMFAMGLPRGETAWSIGLENPRDEKATLAVLNVPPGAVATSSVAKRRWQQGEREQHHLIDPRTGEPAETDWLSVTVIAPRATTAEAFAKALLIAGSRQAERIAARRQDIVYVAVDRNGKLWGPERAMELIDGGLEHA